MRLSIYLFLSAMLFFWSLFYSVDSIAAEAEKNNGQVIIPAGSRPSVYAGEKNFTGRVRVDPAFQSQAPARVYGAYVTFEPGARTDWHTHSLGQTLIVTSGAGLTQEWGGPVKRIRQGDVVICPPGIKHWHGAAPDTAMTHLAISESGGKVDWQEKVSDKEYQPK